MLWGVEEHGCSAIRFAAIVTTCMVPAGMGWSRPPQPCLYLTFQLCSSSHLPRQPLIQTLFGAFKGMHDAYVAAADTKRVP
jgi:hypothetical protein